MRLIGFIRRPGSRRGRSLLTIIVSFVLALAPVAAVMAQQARYREPQVDQPLSPDAAAAAMVVPEGFQVTAFAAEPDVLQPIGFCIDDRGRLWVAEAFNYPQHGTVPGDRITILEDRDGDGRHDRRTVFFEGLNYVTGIEVGFGGAWVMSPPNFYFIPDRNADDVPDGPPEVLLDGFGNHANAHNLANGFAWGPDGWLYGTHGRTNWSTLGKPGTPEKDRVVFDGGVYRYHPIRHEWEPYADGTTNPWGIDWNDVGEAFVSNCVNPHLFHVIQGAHYEPWRNRKSSEFAFERIPTIADHLHFTGGRDARGGLGSEAENAAGGGHAHCGAMIYLGDNWPDQWRNQMFMNNIHGHRINCDLLKRSGSGYSASHGPDVMRSADPWFMGVTLQYGPDGSVFVIDWSDTGECHSVRNTQRQTGRIYRIRYAESLQKKRDVVSLSTAADQRLVELQLHRNDWWVRHARRNLQERFAAGQLSPDTANQLLWLYRTQTDVTRKLRALWALHAIGAAEESFLLSLLDDEQESVQTWAIRLLCEGRRPSSAACQKFAELAKQSLFPSVRLTLASALQQMPVDRRWDIAAALCEHAGDRNDPNIPLMLWYGIEPLIHADSRRFVRLAGQSQIPLIRRHMARRCALAQATGPAISEIMAVLREQKDEQSRIDLLQGLVQGFEGYRTVSEPNGWAEFRRDALAGCGDELASLVTQLSLILNDQEAIAELQAQASDPQTAVLRRRQAIAALAGRRIPGFGSALVALAGDPATQEVALQALAQYSEPETAERLLTMYRSMPADSRQAALQTLSSRREWAARLLDSLEDGRIPRSEITAWTARQIASLADDRLTERLTKVWGEVRGSAADRRRLIEEYRRRMTNEVLSQASLSNGQQLFRRQCGNCHRLFGEGGRIGPDLTGSQRTNLDYLLENLIDPSASVARDYQMVTIVTEAGRIVTGLIETENRQSVVLQTIQERLVIPSAEIESRKTVSVSMMPDGLLSPLTDDDVRDLLAWLSGTGPAKPARQ